jgi:hypothetical protein
MSKIVNTIKAVVDYLQSEEASQKSFGSKVKMKELDAISAFFGLTKREALVFSAVYYLSLTKSSVSPSDISQFISGSPYDLPKIVAQLDKLQKNRLITSRGNAKYDSCKVSVDLMIKLEKDEKPHVNRNTRMDFFEVLDRLDEIFTYRFDEMMSVGEFYEEFDKLYESQTNFSLFTFLQRKRINMREWPMFIYGFLRQIQMDEYGSVEYGIRNLYREYSLRYELKKKFIEEKADLFRKGLIEYPGKDLKSKESFVVRDDAMREILGDRYSIMMADLSTKKQIDGAMLPDSIVPRALFYNQKEQESVNILHALLSPDRLPVVLKGLKDNGMREGICILLHGSPGTGKTESVLQIARQTGRSIMKVDFSQIRDKFVGESEKRLKAVFKKYADFVEGSTDTPILLLNEADALLSKRINVTNSVDQMNNSMQNILLEEMENFKGILVATTNLIPNLDLAFERRFLYKIEFCSPDESVRLKIWQDQFPKLAHEPGFETLALNYALSGGQIENIVRKAKMNELLFLKQPTLAELKEMCENEFLVQTKRSVLGFRSEA